MLDALNGLAYPNDAAVQIGSACKLYTSSEPRTEIALHWETQEARQRIVELLGDVPRIELFARQRVDGWDAWGKEVPAE